MEKESRFDSVVYMWIAFGITIAATLMMFVPQYMIEGQIMSATVNGGFFGNSLHEGAWPSFIGYMAILLGGIITGVLALPFVRVSYKMECFILLCASALELIGIALISMAVVWYCFINGQPKLITHAGYVLQAGAYIADVLALLAIICNVRAILLDK